MAINVNLGQNSTQTINSSNQPSDGNVNLTLASSGTLIVDGVNVDVSNVVGSGIVSNTTIEAINGAQVTIGSNVSGVNVGSTFTYDIGANSGVTFQAATANAGLLNGTTINFENTGGSGQFTLAPSTLNLNLSTIPNITGLSTGDKIEVFGSTSAVLSGHTLTFHYPGVLGIDTTTSFNLTGIPAGSSITFNSATGTAVFACFLRGTRVATPRGQVAIEDLRPGDEVLTLNRGKTPIKWIGRRILDPATIERPGDALPVRICQHAIAENVPHRDLLLSPDHSLFFDGVLIPVKFLINGTTITQETPNAPFEYFHIELVDHDIVMVEGAMAETYLDLSNRQMFGGPGVVQLFPSDSVRDWHDYAYPPAYNGPAVRRVVERLDAQAKSLGYRPEQALAS